MSQGNVAGHDGAGGNTKLACCKALWLSMKVPKATQSLHVARQCGRARWCRRQHKARMLQGIVARHRGAEGNTKLACRKAMWLSMKVPQATQSLHVARQCGRARWCRRQHKARMLQGIVARHRGAEGNTKLACRKAMWLSMKVPQATQSLHVARQCGRAR
ncbi:unnamed protein product [Prunus armeniaca]